MMKEPLAPATFFYTGIVGAQDFVDGKAKDISGYKVVDPYTVQIPLEMPDGAAVPAHVERHVRQDHRRLLHQPRVDLHVPGLLEDGRQVR